MSQGPRLADSSTEDLEIVESQQGIAEWVISSVFVTVRP